MYRLLRAAKKEQWTKRAINTATGYLRSVALMCVDVVRSATLSSRRFHDLGDQWPSSCKSICGGARSAVTTLAIGIALAGGAVVSRDSFAQTYALSCSGCHSASNARVNAAPLISGANGADAATGLTFIGSADTRHGMVAGNASIVTELQTTFGLTAQPRTVAYGGSSGAFPITGLFISPGNGGGSLPLVTTTAPFGGGNGGATSGTLTTKVRSRERSEPRSEPFVGQARSRSKGRAS